MLQTETIAAPAGTRQWQKEYTTENKQLHLQAVAWKQHEKILLRFFFLYFLLQAIPLDWKFYRDLFSIDWAHLYYGDIFNIAHYTPRIVTGSESFLNWLVIAAVALVGTAIWTYRDKTATQYNLHYYWLRAILRYRLAIAVMAYGFIKFFPLQSPFPSISQLNTRYGDFTTWKMFSVSLGAAPLYQSFLGATEILAGMLLLYRKTASIGAFIIIAFTGNVFLSNVAYEGGEFVYSLYLVIMALFLLAFDAGRFYSVLFLERATQPNTFHPVWTGWKKHLRLVAKTAVIAFFVVLYGFKTYEGYRHNPHNIPTTKGLAHASGFYHVNEFRINGQVLPLNAADPVRWQNVVFEKWATLSIQSNRAVIPDIVREEKVSGDNENKQYEEQGAVGRHYYTYTIDSVNQLLTLQHKGKQYVNERLVLHYTWLNNHQLVLDGINENKDPIHVVLDKIDKKYLIREGRRKPQTL